MKSYKVRLNDGKTLSINSEEKLSVKKLSSNFLSFDNPFDNVSRVYINTSHIISIEEHKSVKIVKEKKPKVAPENKEVIS